MILALVLLGFCSPNAAMHFNDKMLKCKYYIYDNIMLCFYGVVVVLIHKYIMYHSYYLANTNRAYV